MRPLQTLTFDAFGDMLRTTGAAIADQRDPRRITWELPAVLRSAVALLFFQHPRLLEYQRRARQSPVPVYWTEQDAADHRVRALCHLALTLPEFQLE